MTDLVAGRLCFIKALEAFTYNYFPYCEKLTFILLTFGLCIPLLTAKISSLEPILLFLYINLIEKNVYFWCYMACTMLVCHKTHQNKPIFIVVIVTCVLV